MSKKTIAYGLESLQQKFISRVYGWMSFALIMTAVTSLYVVSSATIKALVFGNPLVLIGLIILELVAVVSLAAAVDKMSVSTAMSVFVGYSVLNGITLSGLLLVYTGASVAMAFIICAATFMVMSIYGATTQADLTDLGRLSMMGLFGIIIASVVNIFMHSTAMEMIISYVGVLVFVGLIAYDTQKLKAMAQNLNNDEAYQKYAILGALTLYLDFINLFIMILRIVGVRNRD